MFGMTYMVLVSFLGWTVGHSSNICVCPVNNEADVYDKLGSNRTIIITLINDCAQLVGRPHSFNNHIQVNISGLVNIFTIICIQFQGFFYSTCHIYCNYGKNSGKFQISNNSTGRTLSIIRS